MKVYVITKGDYSDYRICAVALDEEEAHRLAVCYSDNEQASVETFDTDEHQPLLAGRVPYVVRLYKRHPASVSVNETCEFTPGVVLGEYCDVVRLYAKNRDAALKIAAEKRAQARAEKEGLT